MKGFKFIQTCPSCFAGAAVVVVLLFGPSLAEEFNFNRVISPFHVYDQNGILFGQPFSGGLNRPVQQLVDIDGDNDYDLFIQENARKYLTFYRNFGTSTDFNFRWEDDRFEELEIGSWFKFADVDNDGDYDLFAEKPHGLIQYYQNNGTASAPDFIIKSDSLKDADDQLIKVSGFSVPDWADIDGDNYLDLFIGNIQDGSITYYNHTGFDKNNTPIFEFITDMFQGLQIITGGVLNNKNLIEHQLEDKHHGANSLTFIDIDNDNDNDLFWGDFFLEGLIYLPNLGTSLVPEFDISTIIENYPQNNPIISGGFNVPRFADIDADDDYDMFIGILGGVISTNLDDEKNLYFYENTGNQDQPFFTLRSKQLINSIDIGKNTVPVLTDIDNDDDFDLFLANEIDLQSPNSSNSRLYFYQNQGSKSNPSFKLINTHFLDYDKLLYDANYSPAFADIDNDNDKDLFLGKWDGKITFYRNEGNLNTPDFILVDEYFDSIDVGSNSTPTFIDIDADDDFDLFIGEQSQNVSSGRINFYINNGTNESPEFELITKNYADIDLGPGEFLYPSFTDIDNDHDWDFFIGTKSKGLVLFRNTGTSQIASFEYDSTFVFPTAQSRLTPSFIDIDNDSDLDIISGCSGGGLVYFENKSMTTAIVQDEIIASEFSLKQNYPNPFNPVTLINYQLPITSYVDLSIYNILGQKVATLVSKEQAPGIYSAEWDASGFASGIYLYTLEIYNVYKQTKKLVLLR